MLPGKESSPSRKARFSPAMTLPRNTPAAVSCPISGCRLPENILQIQSCTPFDEEPDYFTMAAPGGLVQRCRMGMAPHRVVPVWIFASVKQQPNDLDMIEIRCQSECQMAVLTAGCRKQSPR